MLLWSVKDLSIEYREKYDRITINSLDDNCFVSLSQTSFHIFLIMLQHGKNFEKVVVQQNPSEVKMIRYPKGVKVEFTGKKKPYENIY